MTAIHFQVPDMKGNNRNGMRNGGKPRQGRIQEGGGQSSPFVKYLQKVLYAFLNGGRERIAVEIACGAQYLIERYAVTDCRGGPLRIPGHFSFVQKSLTFHIIPRTVVSPLHYRRDGDYP